MLQCDGSAQCGLPASHLQELALGPSSSISNLVSWYYIPWEIADYRTCALSCRLSCWLHGLRMMAHLTNLWPAISGTHMGGGSCHRSFTSDPALLQPGNAVEYGPKLCDTASAWETWRGLLVAGSRLLLPLLIDLALAIEAIWGINQQHDDLFFCLSFSLYHCLLNEKSISL